MNRWLVVSLSLVGFACGGGTREVSKVKYTRVQCNDADCGVTPEKERQAAPPDVEREWKPPGEVPPPVDPNKPGPEPTCRLAAESLVSFELGNYAEPEEREPRVAKEEKRCIAAKLTRDDRQCLIDSNDRASFAYCAPALFPDDAQNAVGAETCTGVGAQIRKNIQNYVQQTNANLQSQQIWDRQGRAAIEACKTDRWNPQMAQCAAAYVPFSPTNCMYTQPYPMWKKLERKLNAAATMK
jgi:hypothetical protein